jgi:hypothetical protein
MSEMAERVARAIYQSQEEYRCAELSKLHGHNYSFLPWEDAPEHWRNMAMGSARAAIEAMREPTEKMIEAGTVGWDALDGSGVRPMFAPQRPYRAMIDEALK